MAWPFSWVDVTWKHQQIDDQIRYQPPNFSNISGQNVPREASLVPITNYVRQTPSGIMGLGPYPQSLGSYEQCLCHRCTGSGSLLCSSSRNYSHPCSFGGESVPFSGHSDPFGCDRSSGSSSSASSIFPSSGDHKHQLDDTFKLLTLNGKDVGHTIDYVATKAPEQSKWKKGKLLGRGSFGHVYAGLNREDGQMCAIKEVHVSDDNVSNECLRQLSQEIALLSRLSHPNIVQYYGSEMKGDCLSVFLEYVSGGSINKLLREYGPFSEPIIRSFTEQILSGLAFLHRKDTVHRDIKGANVLVDANGKVKIADFGVAKHVSSLSSDLSCKGSPYWMAPEVIMNSNGFSLAVDIWSLGCTVIEMATTKPPWSKYENVAALFKVAHSQDYPEIPSHLSVNAQNFIKLCLQRDPSARPTAAQLLRHPFIKNQDANNHVEVVYDYETFLLPR